MKFSVPDDFGRIGAAEFAGDGSGVGRGTADYARSTEKELPLSPSRSPLVPHGARGRWSDGQRFDGDVRQTRVTDAYRLIHGAADGWAEWCVERLGEFLLSQAESGTLNAAQLEELGLQWLMKNSRRARGVSQDFDATGAADDGATEASPAIGFWRSGGGAVRHLRERGEV